MIGPEPISRIDLMSVRLGILGTNLRSNPPWSPFFQRENFLQPLFGKRGEGEIFELSVVTYISPSCRYSDEKDNLRRAGPATIPDDIELKKSATRGGLAPQPCCR